MKNLKRIIKSSFFQLLFFSLAGFLAGFLGGFLGGGGGIIIVFVLKTILKEETAQRKIFATTASLTLPMSAISSVIYTKSAFHASESLYIYILPALLGGILGGIVYSKISFRQLDILFALLMTVSGILLLNKNLV